MIKTTGIVYKCEHCERFFVSQFEHNQESCKARMEEKEKAKREYRESYEYFVRVGRAHSEFIKYADKINSDMLTRVLEGLIDDIPHRVSHVYFDIGHVRPGWREAMLKGAGIWDST